jgi:hypothetical protein
MSQGMKINPETGLEEISVTLSKWKITDKIPCPKCNKQLQMNSEKKYICEPCKVHVKPRIQFNF